MLTQLLPFAFLFKILMSFFSQKHFEEKILGKSGKVEGAKKGEIAENTSTLP